MNASDRAIEAIEEFVAKCESDVRAAALICELLCKVNDDAQKIPWESPLETEDQDGIQALERRLWFITSGNLSVTLMAVNYVLIDLSVAGYFPDKKVEATTKEMLDLASVQISRYFHEVQDD